ncbi:AbrB/MazE/SpoVT family DNA-binding domain-containing protein [Marinoscillum furvescens]|uniref:Putative addiction module antidote n=1 Tax=Marinoscillum furvescens DSM 4134 TaxID=1122208 RepID=A0A3D9L5Z1_MARFU|nr:AbrB/MazE/SpoVT family DNA-binding domain-containing protein [Marinoscillum furvescens]REE01598.1 putative addiction module antidote [Marinoscillum furvescens DSM 4134]
MEKVKVTTVGSSVGIVLPKSIQAKLRVNKGDTITFIETEKGIEITAYDSEFEEQMDVARKVMDQYRNALGELAK